jgi:hypothetical protein
MSQFWKIVTVVFHSLFEMFLHEACYDSSYYIMKDFDLGSEILCYLIVMLFIPFLSWLVSSENFKKFYEKDDWTKEFLFYQVS